MTTLRVLGVIINDRLTATDHVDNLLQACSKLLYALRVLRNHGVPLTSLHDVFRATTIAKLTYYAPAWSGFSSAADRRRLDNFLKRCIKLGYCDNLTPSTSLNHSSQTSSHITELFDVADQSLFKTVLSNSHHVLHRLLPKNKTSVYNLRTRAHNLTFTRKSCYYDNCNFITRMLFKGPLIHSLFTCVSYAEARLSYSLDVRSSVCPSHAGIVSKRVNILSCFLHHTIAHSF